LGQAFGEKISAGVQLDYLKNQIAEGYSNKGVMTVEVGLMMKVIKNLLIGVHVFNPVRVKINDYNNERLATIMKLGASYMFSEKVMLAIEVNKSNSEQPQFKAGLEYLILKELYLRAGIGTNPSTMSFGVGVNLKQFKIDLSSSYHQVLGYTPQIGIVYTAKND